MLDLRHGTVVKTLIPKIAEGKTFQITLRNEEKVSIMHFFSLCQLLGIFNVISKFNETNEYVLYYHSGRKTLRVFRVADGAMIANYR